VGVAWNDVPGAGAHGAGTRAPEAALKYYFLRFLSFFDRSFI